MLKTVQKVLMGVSSGYTYAYDLDTGAKHTTFSKHGSSVNKATRVNDHNIATVSDDQSLTLWDSSNGHYICSYNHSGQVKSVVVLPNGLIATSTCGDNLVYMWNVTNGMNVANLTGHTDCVTDLAYNPSIGSEGALISVGLDHCVKLWSFTTFALINSQCGWGGAFNTLFVMPNGNYYAVSTWLEGFDTSYTHHWYPTVSTNASSSAVLPDGVNAAIGLVNGDISIFSSVTQTIKFTLTGAHTGAINAIIAIRMPGLYQVFFATGGDDTYVKMWTMGSSSLTKLSTLINTNSAVKSLFHMYDQTGSGKLKFVYLFHYII
jgi:WD40 repeat protein